MADLKALAESMRKWAKSSRDLGDNYDEGGNTERAQYYWGISVGYHYAAEMVEWEIEREAGDV